MTFMVYWTEVQEDGTLAPCAETFGPDAMTGGMALMEGLRKRSLADGSIRFVCMSSENPNSVGKPGVDTVGPDYNWTKRRGNMPGFRKDRP